MDKQRRISKGCIYLLSALLPLFLMAAVCMVLEITPFGNKTLIFSDMSNQYIDYFSYFKSLFANSGHNLFYTFGKNLGGDMFGFAAYYLFSPFNLILLLFSNKTLSAGITIMLMLKVSCCGLTFCHYLNSRREPRWISLLFSTSYALIGYNLTYCFNIMWLDGVVLLPLVVLGLEQLFAGGKARLYVVSLVLSLISNYYIGYMLCIFSLLYFLYKLFFCEKKFTRREWRKKQFGRFFIYTLLAVGLSAVVLIPTFLSLQGSKFSFSISRMALYGNFSFFSVFSKLFTGTSNWTQIVDGGLPQIFCGIAMAVFAIQYFFNRSIEKKQKLGMTFLLCAILLSFWLNTINLIWHGFSPPIWFPYRYSFILSFLLISLAYCNFVKAPEGLSGKSILLSAAVFTLMALFVILTAGNADNLSVSSLIGDALLAIGCSALLYIYIKNKKEREPAEDRPTYRRRWAMRTALIALSIVQMVNLAVNGYITINNLQEPDYETAYYLSEYFSQTQEVVDSIKAQDPSFYRLEKTFFRSTNDAMQFGYNGVSHYSSCQKYFVKAFLAQLGFKNNGYWAYYRYGSTATADSLLGVKYLLNHFSTNKSYELLMEQNGIRVYKNPYALPLGFAVSQDALGVNVYAQKNTFETQNSIFRSMVDEDMEDIFRPADVVSVSTTNLREEQGNGYTTYTKVDSAEDAYVEYTISVDSTDELYGYLYAPDLQNAEIYVNGVSLGGYFTYYRWDAFSLGCFDKGDTVTFRVKLWDDSLIIDDNSCFYYENENILGQYYNALSGGFCNLIENSSSHFTGTVTVEGDNQYLLFSIPCESGWTVKVDGKKVETEMVFNALTGVRVSAGTHTLELTFVPDGLYVGAAITGVSLASALVFLILRASKKKRLPEEKQ